MAIHVSIGSSRPDVLFEGLSFDIQGQIPGRAVIPVLGAVGDISKGDAVAITAESAGTTHTLWSGVVTHVPTRGVAHEQTFRFDIAASFVAERLLELRVWMKKEDATISDWLTSLNTDWLAGEGFTLDVDASFQIDGVRKYENVRAWTLIQELTRLSSREDYVFVAYVTADKVIHVKEITNLTQAAFNVDEDSISSSSATGAPIEVGSLVVNPFEGEYCNIIRVEGGIGQAPLITYEMERKTAEIHFDPFGDELCSVSEIRTDEGGGFVVRPHGERGVVDSNPGTGAGQVQFLWSREGVERIEGAGAWTTDTQDVEIDGCAETPLWVIVRNESEITARGKVWGETVTLPGVGTLGQLIAEAQMTIDRKSRYAVDAVQYAYRAATSEVAGAGSIGASDGLVRIEDRLQIGQVQTLTRTKHGLSSVSAIVQSIRATVETPCIVRYEVMLHGGQPGAAFGEEARSATGQDSAGLALEDQVFRHPALFGGEVLETDATAFSFVEV